MGICPILHVEGKALLMPCSVADSICGLEAYLVHCIYSDRFLVFAS